MAIQSNLAAIFWKSPRSRSTRDLPTPSAPAASSPPAPIRSLPPAAMTAAIPWTVVRLTTPRASPLGGGAFQHPMAHQPPSLRTEDPFDLAEKHGGGSDEDLFRGETPLDSW